MGNLLRKNFVLVLHHCGSATIETSCIFYLRQFFFQGISETQLKCCIATVSIASLLIPDNLHSIDLIFARMKLIETFLIPDEEINQDAKRNANTQAESIDER